MTLDACPARVAKQDLNALVPSTEKQETCALYFGIEADWDPADLQSNTFEMEWPPRSGRQQSFPELDRASWFGIAEARLKILKGQAVFLDHLLEALGRADGG